MSLDPEKSEIEIVRKISDFWKDNPISTGIPLLDLQHIWLIRIIFQLEHILSLDDHTSIRDAVVKSLFDVIDFAGVHFVLEEDIMREFAFPKLEEHTKVHRDFAEKIKDRFENFGDDEIVAHGLLSVLKKWLFNHILHDDKEYSEFFKSTGAKVNVYCEKIISSKKYSISKSQVLLYNQIVQSKTIEVGEVVSGDIVGQVRNIWKAYNLPIHVPIIDLQHIWLLKMIMELDRALKDNSSTEKNTVLKSVIQGAIQYTEEHFEIEEKFMKQFRYPDQINHSTQHTRFIKFVKTRSEEEALGNPMVAEHLVLDLKNWLLSHIAFEDRKLGVLLKGKTHDVSQFTKKIHQSGDLQIREEQKNFYKAVMKS